MQHCGVSDAVSLDPASTKWPAGMVVYYYENMQFPGLDRETVAATYDQAAAEWSRVCGIKLVRTDDVAKANIVSAVAPIDGRNGVLALSELPYGATAETVLRQQYDPPEDWTQRDELLACIAHELGHAIGLPHLPGTGALMEPVLVLGRHAPQAPDVVEAIARYGAPSPLQSPDWAALGRSLRPYVVGPWADGLTTAAKAIEAGADDGHAQGAALGVVTAWQQKVWAALLAPKIAGLDKAAKAAALRRVAEALARA